MPLACGVFIQDEIEGLVRHHYPRHLDRGIRERAPRSGTVKQLY
jgi:hypothetical protein